MLVKRSNWEVKPNSPTAHAREHSKPVKEGIVLTKDVYYGRAIVQLPREEGLLGVAGLQNRSFQESLSP